MENEIINDSSDKKDDMTLDEYLSTLTCNGCGKRCPLLSPRCMRGENQAEEAKESYYSEYGTTN